jgi:Tfp pilus assembly protein PilX
MFHHIQHDTDEITSEAGFALIMAMVALLVLTLLGIWALNTSTFELRVAGESQQVEKQFNVAEGGAYAEAVNVGFTRKTWYGFANFNPGMKNPTTDAQFDPGNDTTNLVGGIDSADPATWPWDNLRDATTAAGQDPAANALDYRCLVAYLGSTTPPLGYDATLMSAHQLRIQGAAPLVVELGGMKLSPNK